MWFIPLVDKGVGGR